MTEVEWEVIPMLQVLYEVWLNKHRGQWGVERQDVRTLTVQEVCGICTDLGVRWIGMTDEPT